MGLCTFSDRLSTSWKDNAEGWTQAIRKDLVESRRLATHAAILDAVIALAPGRVIDVGCGEGWLCRALRSHGIAVSGLDGAEPLIARAREADPDGDYRVMNYAEIAYGSLPPADVVVCNFALLDADLRLHFKRLSTLARESGRLIVQTLHPVTLSPYVPGWREEHFEGFELPFPSPMPWYAHTLSAWINDARSAGWRLDAVAEPRHPVHGTVLSILYTYTLDP